MMHVEIDFLLHEVKQLKHDLNGLAEDHAMLKHHLFQLAQKVEEEHEPAETFTEERTSDGGTMTIKNGTIYQDIADVLIRNGYFVCCHVDDSDGETMTIEYWRA